MCVCRVWAHVREPTCEAAYGQCYVVFFSTLSCNNSDAHTRTHIHVGGAAASNQKRHVVLATNTHFSKYIFHMEQVFAVSTEYTDTPSPASTVFPIFPWKRHLLIPHQVRQLVSTQITDCERFMQTFHSPSQKNKLKNSTFVCLLRWDAHRRTRKKRKEKKIKLVVYACLSFMTNDYKIVWMPEIIHLERKYKRDQN